MPDDERTTSQKSRRRATAETSDGHTVMDALGEGQNAGTMMRAMAGGFRHYMQTNEELARFYSNRFRKNIETMRRLSTCRDAQSFSDAWSHAASETAHDYADEFDKLLAINTAPLEEE